MIKCTMKHGGVEFFRNLDEILDRVEKDMGADVSNELRGYIEDLEYELKDAEEEIEGYRDQIDRLKEEDDLK